VELIFVCLLSKNVTAQPVFQSYTVCFVSWSLLRLWMAKNFFGWTNKW